MKEFHYLNGDIVHIDNAHIPINDIALGRGYGTFDYFQVWKGVPMHMDHHITRFMNSIRLLRLKTDITSSELKDALYRLLEKNNTDSAGVKLIATGGASANGFSIGQASIAIILQNYVEANQEQVMQGVRVLSYEYQRLLPEIKSINYLYAVYLSDKLDAAHAIEPLYYTSSSVRETARANIMAVINGRIVTPDEKILRGITRQTIIDEINIPCECRNITLDEMKSADEVFLCGTTKRALGVVKIDETVIGDGTPGPITMDVRKQLLDIEAELILQGKQ